MDYSELMKQDEKVWKDYEAIEKNTLKQITGDSLEEQIQKANREVNQNLQNFKNSDEYKTVIKNMKDTKLTRALDFVESSFPMYVNQKDLRLNTYYEDDGISIWLSTWMGVTVPSEDDTNHFLAMHEMPYIIEECKNLDYSHIHDIPLLEEKCKDLKGAYKVNIWYDSTYTIFDITEDDMIPETNVTGREIYDGLQEYLGNVKQISDQKISTNQLNEEMEESKKVNIKDLTSEEKEEADKIFIDKTAHPEKYSNLDHKSVPLDFEKVTKLAEDEQSGSTKKDESDEIH